MTRTGTLGFIVQSGTTENAVAGEVFDMAVAAGVFDRPVALCFQGSGLLHLAAHDPPEGQRSVSRLWQSAGLFGVTAFYALTAERDLFSHLVAGPISAQVEWLSRAQWQETLTQWEQVIVL